MPATDLGRMTVGTLRDIDKQYLDQDGNPADPDGVQVALEAPGLPAATMSFGGDDQIQRLNVGLYVVQVMFDVPGLWFLRWQSAGDLEAGEDMVIFVEPSPLWPLPGS